MRMDSKIAISEKKVCRVSSSKEVLVMFWGQKQTVGSLWCAGGSAAHAHGSAGRSSAGECWLRPNCSSQPPSLDALLLTCDIFPASASLCCRRLGFGFGGWACRSDSFEIDVFKLCTSTVYVLGRCGRSKKSIASTKFYFQRLLGSGGEQRSGGGGGGGGPGCQGDQGKKMMHHCQICNRGFLNKSNIKVHLRTHTGEKPFGCEHCSKAFRQKAHLLKHMSIHKRISRD